MGFQSYITAVRLGIFSFFNFSSPETTIPESPSERSTSPSNETPLKPHNSQVPSIRSFHPNELYACIKIQKITRDYLTRRKLAAINWINDQLKDQQLTNRFFENNEAFFPAIFPKIRKSRARISDVLIPAKLTSTVLVIRPPLHNLYPIPTSRPARTTSRGSF